MRHVLRALPWIMCLWFVGVFLANAWMVDEAYVTFRTVENFLEGRGLTWNPGERVQGYTHPLWMLLMVLVAGLTREFFFTTLAVSLVCSLGGVWMAHRTLGRSDLTTLFVLLLVTSKAFVDFTTSGLENPLSHFLVGWLLFRLLRVNPDQVTARELFWLTGLATAIVLNRFDLGLLVAPPLIALALRRRRRDAIWCLLAGGMPLVLWLLFSVVYYGFPFPNTYYAKLAATGVAWGDKIEMGLAYVGNSWRWDPLTQLVMVVGMAMVLRRPRTIPVSLVVGVLAYVGYTIGAGAAATHMSGRFFSVPFLVMASLLVVHLPERARWGLVGVVLVLSAVNPRSPLKFGTSWHATDRAGGYVIDTKLAVYEEGSTLWSLGDAASIPNHEWFRAGLAFRDSDRQAEMVSAPGYFGYAAGPEKWVIDVMGLCDPLLARLPGRPFGRGGHFVRATPPGYARTLTEPGIHLEDAGLREFYQGLHRIVTGPIFEGQRWQDIVDMNLGRRDHLLSAYIEQSQRAGWPGSE